jgi:hypothetical protein
MMQHNTSKSEILLLFAAAGIANCASSLSYVIAAEKHTQYEETNRVGSEQRSCGHRAVQQQQTA